MSLSFKTVQRGFAADEPHPSDDALCWLRWNDHKTKSYLPWAAELQSICSCDYQELARKMVLSWQWPVAVAKLGILNIPCPPPPDHLKMWMFKIDDLVHMRLSANHYLCIQYARALQFYASITTNASMCRPVSCLEAFITAMSPYYKITRAMWQTHIPTPPFMKPHMEITPHHQAT